MPQAATLFFIISPASVVSASPPDPLLRVFTSLLLLASAIPLVMTLPLRNKMQRRRQPCTWSCVERERKSRKRTPFLISGRRRRREAPFFFPKLKGAMNTAEKTSPYFFFRLLLPFVGRPFFCGDRTCPSFFLFQRAPGFSKAADQHQARRPTQKAPRLYKAG